MFNVRKEALLKFLKILFPIALLAIAIYEILQTISGIDVHLLRKEVNELQIWELLFILFITFCAITPMIFYDVILVKILGIKINNRILLNHSFIVNTFSNLIGFGGLVGVFLRNYFYSKYKEDKEYLLKTIASVTLFYLTGISLLVWIMYIFFWDFPLLKEVRWLSIAVILVSLYVPVFIAMHIIRYKKTSSLNPKIALQLIVTSVAEWFAVFLVIWILTFILNIPIELSALIPIFLIASSAGIVSMIPGGVGSFDLVFLWGTQSVGIADEKVLFLLILYRVGYFVLPFLVSSFLFIKEYWKRWNQSWDDLPNVIFQRLSHMLLTILVFISGIVLLLSASVPGVLTRLKIAQEFLSSPIMNVSHQMTVAAGFILLGLCRGIKYKVKRAYQLTIIVLSSSALFSIFKGLDYEEAIFLMIVTGLLIASKKQFYRESYVLTWGIVLFDLAAVTIITVMYLLIGYVNLPTSKIHIPATLQVYIITDYRDLFYSAVIGILIAIVIFYIGYFIRAPKKMEKLLSSEQEDTIKNHLMTYKGTEYSHLIFLHDKFVHWNEKGTVLFSYQIYADKIVVLGDPVGNESDFLSAIQEFLELADKHGYTPVFYEINNKIFSSLHEHGYSFFKLGEEAFVDLEKFTLVGKGMKGSRAIKNKFERENFTLELISPPYSQEVMNELEEVSMKWLQGRAEKGFSLGFFDEHYLNTSKIVVLRGAEEVIGFASIMPMYDNGERISVDLMRFKPGAPSGTMDFIFLSLFEWAKAQGYRVFNMGMSPLSNVGQSRYSFLSEKIAAQIFLHGQHFYHFKGLKNFKLKYADFWEPKYVAYRKKSSLPFTMAQVTLLIGKRRR
ncbi:bifunctional lysylphosphatidylglycerol flippase/synthetase MprF [Lysinibacillus agricola]|uniref:Phosphatidylglycerol lysyltransferase n=1 Tax=Lysinibacillus agricola TaxID=2590012 RepID=A0ABX7AU10_9BACI|nr:MULTISPECIES: bifunctional lysylphosphatidylglycerol flippase/synthetase MprF [Lysinibacillus]KOS62447.1 lysylphosphatidylglycerol synthetase [Lysinibacillus sp. FJAT-14222]QQP13452.1 bifunctional lysylphosphatidylglycerol flippase/synthetase MprF [Lysinibacillus agricola]